MKTRTKEERKQFVKENYVTCPHCKYNNEKMRLRKYGLCLNCGKILDEKTYFLIQIKKRLDDNKRKSE